MTKTFELSANSHSHVFDFHVCKISMNILCAIGVTEFLKIQATENVYIRELIGILHTYVVASSFD